MSIKEMTDLYNKKNAELEELRSEFSSEIVEATRDIMEGTGALLTPHFHYPKLRVSIHTFGAGYGGHFVQFPEVDFVVEVEGFPREKLNEIREALFGGDDENKVSD